MSVSSCSFLTLLEEHTEVAESLLTSPTKLLPVMDLALFRACTKVLDGLKEEGRDASLSLKTNLHARITGEETVLGVSSHPLVYKSLAITCR